MNKSPEEQLNNLRDRLKEESKHITEKLLASNVLNTQ